MTGDHIKFNKKASAYLINIWGERDIGIDVASIDWSKPIRRSDVEFLLKQYGYLQLINSDPVWEDSTIPQFIKASSGWMIHDYGQAMSASPGPLLFGPGNPELKAKQSKEADDESGSGDAGSVIQQTFDTAATMVQLAMNKGWPAVEIVSGTDLMQWAAWFAARGLEYTLYGYEATEKDEEKRQRVMRLRRERGLGQPGIMPGVT